MRLLYNIFMRIRINITINRAIQILLVYLFVIVTTETLYVPIFAVFVTQTSAIVDASLRTVGFALAFYAIAKSVVQVPLARFLDNHKGERDDFYILMAGGLMSAIYPFFLLLVSRSWHLYLVEI